MKKELLFLALFFLAISNAWAKYQPMSVMVGGTISGKVTYSGKAESPKKINLNVDKAVCGAHGPVLSEDLIVNSQGGVKNAVVYLSNITQGKPLLPGGDAVLDQQGCKYVPHILVIGVGQKLKILNSDGILHNVHSHSLKNPPINFAQPGSVKEIEVKPFAIPELIKLTCDVHGWMSAYIWVTEHPYTVVTKEDGSFEIPGVPAGKYQVKFWHETLGELTQEVEVKANKPTQINAAYPSKAEAKTK